MVFPSRRSVMGLVLCSLTAKPVLAASQRTELVMFERSGCPWCQRWEREVEPVYGKTDVGKNAPLRKINLDREKPEGLALLEPVRFTPTFVVVEDGREVGRITGYSSDAMFWGLLEKITTQAAAVTRQKISP
jgi:thioredoxin-related protein